MTINEIQDELIAEFSYLDEWMDKYALLMEMGNELTPLDACFKISENLIDGCQSRVWLEANLVDGKMQFQAEADALIVKGIVALLIRICNDQTPQDLIESDFYFIDEIGLREHLSSTRSNGLVAMIRKLKMYAFAWSKQ